MEKTEFHKYLSDVVELNQNILLIADGDIRELPEIKDTYTDTWGKLVKFIVVRKFVSGTETIYTITPDFENIQYIDVTEPPPGAEKPERVTSEEYHLEDVAQIVKDIYWEIKNTALSIDNSLIINPQKYYISIKKLKNIAFAKFRKKKIHLL